MVNTGSLSLSGKHVFGKTRLYFGATGFCSVVYLWMSLRLLCMSYSSLCKMNLHSFINREQHLSSPDRLAPPIPIVCVLQLKLISRTLLSPPSAMSYNGKDSVPTYKR